MFDGFPTLTPLHGRPDGRRGADALTLAGHRSDRCPLAPTSFHKPHWRERPTRPRSRFRLRPTWLGVRSWGRSRAARAPSGGNRIGRRGAVASAMSDLVGHAPRRLRLDSSALRIAVSPTSRTICRVHNPISNPYCLGFLPLTHRSTCRACHDTWTSRRRGITPEP